jgi:uncharacterized membrane protein YhaH (DUF805 family)
MSSSPNGAVAPKGGTGMGWFFMPYARYADFSGRSTRREYWAFTLLIFLIYGVFAVVDRVVVDSPADGLIADAVKLLILGGSLVPSFAVCVRRMHDQDRSGWFVLLWFVPVVGPFIALVMTLLPGTDGDNRYGDDPR